MKIGNSTVELDVLALTSKKYRWAPVASWPPYTISYVMVSY